MPCVATAFTWVLAPVAIIEKHGSNFPALNHGSAGLSDHALAPLEEQCVELSARERIASLKLRNIFFWERNANLVALW